MFDTSTLGTLFVVVGLAAMFLMYHLWGYPYDKATRTSAAPRWAMWTHRVLGYLFALIYIALMWNMVPRLWEYQVEFPARTTVHIVIGFGVGFLLLIKIAIMRFFRHFEEWMPYLGTAIMLGTVILAGLSLPFAWQERALARAAPGGSPTSPQSIARVAQLLPSAGLPSDAELAQLATADALGRGRDVLLGNCVKCHDLRTILAKPRTPAGWWSTVERMSEKPALFAPLAEREMYEVTAYLIAITPDLQRSAKQKKRDALARDQAATDALTGEDGSTSTLPTAQPPSDAPSAPPTTTGSAATPAATPPVTPDAPSPPAKPAPANPPAVDLAKAKRVYEQVCSQCHDLSDVDAAPPRTAAEVRSLIQRMIRENEAEMTREQIRYVTAWMQAHFVERRP